MNQRKSGKGKGKSFEDITNQKFRNPSQSTGGAAGAHNAGQEETIFPGAIKKNTLIMAKMRNSESFHIAKIIEVRIALEGANQSSELLIDAHTSSLMNQQQNKPAETNGSVAQNEGDAEMDDESNQNPSAENKSKKSKPPAQKFEYYITYLGHQRRNDRWITEEELRIDEDEIQREFGAYEERVRLEKENADFLYNDEHLGLNEKQIIEFEESTKIKSVEFIEMGKHRVETWYFSPFPKEYHCRTLYICEFCLLFFVHKNELIRHSERCKVRCPPGDEIYRDDSVSMFEIDGKNQQVYCENLCRIAKLFLDHKTLFYEIDPFHFYVLCEHDAAGYHIVGYFSKEKVTIENNLSCILVMPYCQRKGYGKLLIEFSYELSKKEQRSGTPERPLSDLGHRTYVSFWTQKLLKILLENEGRPLSIQDLSTMTSITPTDIMYVLENFKILRYHQGNYILYTDKDFLTQILKSQGHPGRPVITENIHWIPHSNKPDKFA